MPDIQFFAICFYFLLPVYAANVTPILAKRFNVLPGLALPIDCNASWKGKPVLGPHKTLRGFLLGTAAAMVVGFTQTILYPVPNFPTLGLVDYASINPLVLGFLLGFGSLLGDSLGSFIKRRAGKKPGETFPVLDQTGMTIVAIVAVIWAYPLPIAAIIAGVSITFVWHVIAARMAYVLNIREEKW